MNLWTPEQKRKAEPMKVVYSLAAVAALTLSVSSAVAGVAVGNPGKLIDKSSARRASTLVNTSVASHFKTFGLKYYHASGDSGGPLIKERYTPERDRPLFQMLNINQTKSRAPGLDNKEVKIGIDQGDSGGPLVSESPSDFQDAFGDGWPLEMPYPGDFDRR
jgi:hypothetical protein